VGNLKGDNLGNRFLSGSTIFWREIERIVGDDVTEVGVRVITEVDSHWVSLE